MPRLRRRGMVARDPAHARGLAPRGALLARCRGDAALPGDARARSRARRDVRTLGARAPRVASVRAGLIHDQRRRAGHGHAKAWTDRMADLAVMRAVPSPR